MASYQLERAFSVAIRHLAAERFWMATQPKPTDAGKEATTDPASELGVEAQKLIKDGAQGEIAGGVYQLLEQEGGPRAEELTAALVEAYPYFAALVRAPGFSPHERRELLADYKNDVLDHVSESMRIHIERSLLEVSIASLGTEVSGPRSAGLNRQETAQVARGGVSQPSGTGIGI